DRGRQQVELGGCGGRLVADALLLDRDGRRRHGDAPERQLEAQPALAAQRVLDVGRRLLLRLRVVVAAERLDDGAAGDEVELAYEPLLAEVQIDRALVHGRVRTLALDEAEQRAGARVDHG